MPTTAEPRDRLLETDGFLVVVGVTVALAFVILDLVAGAAI